MDIQIDPGSPHAPYDQDRLQIIEQVRDGRLIAGTKIPTVRALAADIGIAPNTVAKAYRELAEAGVIDTRGKQGTFIAESGDPTRSRAEAAVTRLVRELREVGMNNDDVLRLVRAALKAPR
ncbi:MAG: GntR family transcriptional regulator [Rhodococcus sp.]|nr:GntR family transcriptional regulator [Rhodococcus sp. (in: high G+C Gram-positive bacteria)]